VLVRELPGTSRLALAVRGGAEHDGWDVPAHLLAAVVDAVNANTHAVIQVQSRTRVRAPRPVPRPGCRPQRRTVRIADLPGARLHTPG
jgi:hypothetical protein